MKGIEISNFVVEEMVSMKNENFTLSDISDKLKFSKSTISRSLIKNGHRQKQWKYDFDKSFFEKIDMEEKSYFGDFA